MLFIKTENYKILQESTDGCSTFEICPKHFYQVCVLYALIKKKGTDEIFIPLVYILITRKIKNYVHKYFVKLVNYIQKII